MVGEALEATPIGPPPTKSRCLIGVKRVVMTVRWSLPVYPHEQTFSEFGGMSQTCQNQKSP